jgi:hypothetical protein
VLYQQFGNKDGPKKQKYQKDNMMYFFIFCKPEGEKVFAFTAIPSVYGESILIEED